MVWWARDGGMETTVVGGGASGGGGGGLATLDGKDVATVKGGVARG
jgi:ABC-type nitrate/sulfonate/bicarbonate transport system substrate-binding protein